MKLTKEILLEAISKSVGNAGQLVDEAKILKDNKRFARAFALYQLSIEEIGKASMSLGFLLFGNIEDATEQKQFLREFREHKTKTKRAMGIDLSIARTIDNRQFSKVLISNVLKQYEEIDKINDYKNYSLYTSFINGTVCLPSEVVTQTLLEDLGFYAEMRYLASKQYFEISIKNLDSLVKAIGKMDFDKVMREGEKFIKEIMSE